MNSDKDLADQLDAEDRLRARGMEKKTCQYCSGTGPIQGCVPCQNKGYTWEPRHPMGMRYVSEGKPDVDHAGILKELQDRMLSTMGIPKELMKTRV